MIRRRVLPMLFILALAALVSASAPPDGVLPDEIVRSVRPRALAYATRALKFTCRERLRHVKYKDGAAAKESIEEYDYLLAYENDDPRAPWVALRARPGEPEAGTRRRDLAWPEPYAFTQLFAAQTEALRHFEVGRWRMSDGRLVLPITWTATGPVGSLTQVGEWSGRIEVEHGTGNIVRIVAEPNLQNERVEALRLQYQQAFSWPWGKAAPKPIGYELQIDFRETRDGLTYPSRAELLTFRKVGRNDGDRVPIRRDVAEYSAYRFFNTEALLDIPPLRYREGEVTQP